MSSESVNEIITVRHVFKSVTDATGTLDILRDIDFRLNRGETAVVKKVKGCDTVRQRLIDLGLNPGAKVQVLKNEHSGPMIVAVKGDGRLALGRNMTHRVLVIVDGG